MLAALCYRDSLSACAISSAAILSRLPLSHISLLFIRGDTHSNSAVFVIPELMAPSVLLSEKHELPPPYNGHFPGIPALARSMFFIQLFWKRTVKDK